MANNLMVFTGNANPVLAEKIARYIGIPLGDAQIGKFSDGEIAVEIKENVRGKDVFIIQSTCAPTNDSLILVTHVRIVVYVPPALPSAPRLLQT